MSILEDIRHIALEDSTLEHPVPKNGLRHVRDIFFDSILVLDQERNRHKGPLPHTSWPTWLACDGQSNLGWSCRTKLYIRNKSLKDNGPWVKGNYDDKPHGQRYQGLLGFWHCTVRVKLPLIQHINYTSGPSHTYSELNQHWLTQCSTIIYSNIELSSQQGGALWFLFWFPESRKMWST